MASLTTARVGLNQQTLAAAPVAGAEADQVLIVNLDTANTVNLGSSPTNLPWPLGPLASTVLTAPVYAAAATVPLLVGIAPGGVSYSPGSLTITGPVTAEITGPVEISDIEGGTVTFTNDTIDVIGNGGYITPGQVARAFINIAAFNCTAGSNAPIANAVSVATFASIIFTQNGVSASSVAAGAAVCAMWEFIWFDTGGTVIGTDAVSCLIGSSATWEIPCRGQSFTLNMINVGTVGTLTAGALGIIVSGSYRVIPNVRVVSSALNVSPVITGSTVVVQSPPVSSVPFANISQWIASIAFTWSGAVSSVVFPFPQWAGQVSGFYQVITTALARNATIVDLSYALQNNVVAGSGYPYGIIQNIPAAIDASPVQLTFNLPPTQCALVLDTPASAGQFFLSLIGVGN